MNTCKALLAAAAVLVAGATGGAAQESTPSWVLPLAPAAYGGPGVINPYSNVNPLNPMAAQMQQQAAGGARGNVPQTAMGPAYTSGLPAQQQVAQPAVPPAFLEADAQAAQVPPAFLEDDEVMHRLLMEGAAADDLQDASMPAGAYHPPAFNFRALEEQHAAHHQLKVQEDQQRQLVVPGAAGPHESQVDQGACQGCRYVGQKEQVAAPARQEAAASCGQCPAEHHDRCSCATQEVRTTVLKPNGTKVEFVETASCACRKCPCEQQFVTPELKAACGCKTCPCAGDSKQYVKPELKANETRLGPCDCKPDDENCKCRLRAQRLADAKEAAESKYTQPEYKESAPSGKPRVVTVEPERPACQEGCKRHQESGECQCNTVAPEIKEDCPCHDKPECACRRPVTEVVHTTHLKPSAGNKTEAAKPKAQEEPKKQ